MRVQSEDVINPGWFAHSFRPPSTAEVFVCKVTCQIESGKVAVPLLANDAKPLNGDMFEDDDPKGQLLYPNDFVPFKPKVDLLFSGTAFVPKNGKQQNLDVSWKVGGWSKHLRVFGDRKWIIDPMSTNISPAVSFHQMPLDYCHSFGGLASKSNPLGKGFGQSSANLPNIELPGKLVKSPSSDVTPAGFAPIPSAWFPRNQNLGTYDDTWQKTRWPWLPSDFDYRCFNAAPLDQQLDRSLVGNEEILFENLHPKHAVYQTWLPGIRVRCFVGKTNALDESIDKEFREVTMQLDTLFVDMHAEQLVLIWRGATPTESLKMREIQSVFLMTESIENPAGTKADCLAIYRLRCLEQDGDDPLANDQESAIEAKKALDAEAEEKEFKAAMAQADQMEKEARASALSTGATPEQLSPSPNSSVADVAAALKATADSLRSSQPDVAVQMDAEAKELEGLEAEMASDNADAKRLTREDVQRMAMAKESFADCDLSELELDDLDLSGLDFSRANFSECFLIDSNLAGAMCLETNFEGADLSYVNLEGAVLDGANFTNAILEEANFRSCSIENTNFSLLDLKNLDFSGVRGRGAYFNGADLTEADFSDASLPQCDFCDSILIKANFTNARLQAAQFEKVNAQHANFQGADISGLHASDGSNFSEAKFTESVAGGSIWEDSILDLADFTQANLTKSLFTNASLKGTKLDSAALSFTVFDDADLTGASMQDSNLLRTSMDRANLTNALLRNSNLYGAGFWDTILKNTDLRGANIRGTVLKS